MTTTTLIAATGDLLAGGGLMLLGVFVGFGLTAASYDQAKKR